jgi:hypothetical protein
MTTPRTTVLRLVLLGALALCASAARAADNPHADAFVSEYRCDGERALAVSYPAPRARDRVPVQLAWNGESVAMTRAAPAGGLRWTSRTADLAWTTQGRSATLSRASDGIVLASGCREQ